MTDSAGETANSLIGTIVGERYKVVSRISGGGNGDVYEVLHVELNRPFAAKILHYSSTNENGIKRLQREAQVLARLDHPNVLKVHALVYDQDHALILIMDLLKGPSLRQIANGHRLIVGLALRLTIDVCRGLEAAHAQGILHRDIKPDNVIVLQEGTHNRAMLIDFGLAKVEQVGQDLTQTSMFYGTPLYMSPEQCRGDRLDARSDIYSLGCMIYEVLTGRTPFVGDTALDVMRKHLSEAAPPLSETNPELFSASELNRIVAKAPEKNPDDRYQTVAQLRAELEEYRAKPFVASSSLVNRFRLRKKILSKAKIAALLAVAGLACLSAFAVVQFNRDKEPLAASTSEFQPEFRPAELYAGISAARTAGDDAEVLRLAKILVEKRRSSTHGRATEAAAADYIALADIYWHEGMLKEADQLYEDGLSQYKALGRNVPNLLFSHALLSIRLKNYAKAEQLCKASIQGPMNGQNINRTTVLASIYSLEHRETESRKILTDLMRSDLDTDARQTVCYLTGGSYFNQGKYKDSVEWFNKCNQIEMPVLYQAQAALANEAVGEHRAALRLRDDALRSLAVPEEGTPLEQSMTRESKVNARAFLRSANLLPPGQTSPAQ